MAQVKWLREVTVVDTPFEGFWHPASLDAEAGPAWAWRRWWYDWDAVPGSHVLSARAVDATGRTQPVSPAWNRGGFANNLVQRVEVRVT